MTFAYKLTLAALVVFSTCAWALEEPPALLDDRLETALYGDETNVMLLAGLLDDTDPLVREKALLHLSQTDNPTAGPIIAKMLDDPVATVKAAAVQAAANLNHEGCDEIIAQGLESDDKLVVFAAIRGARQVALVSARQALYKLAASDDEFISASALLALTEMNLACPPDILLKSLESPIALVRFRAAQNAAIGEISGDVLDRIMRMSREDEPDVRAAALLAVLRCESIEQVEQLAVEAIESDSAIVRASGVRALTPTSKSSLAASFLDDPSPVVRLAAVNVVTDTKDVASADKITQIMLDVDDLQTHLATRQALRQLGAEVAVGRAVKILEDLEVPLHRTHGIVAGWSKEGKSTPELVAQSAKLQRNASSAAWLLGEFNSAAGIDVMVRLIDTLHVDNSALVELSAAAAKSGDLLAVAPLFRALEKCRDGAREHLAVSFFDRPPKLPHDTRVTAAVLHALADFEASEALEIVQTMVFTNVNGMRLTGPVVACAQAMSGIADPQDAQKMLSLILEDDAFGPAARYEAARAAGRMKITPLLKLLHERLNSAENRAIIHACAWAIEQITGEAPPLIEPMPNQGDWIIKTASDR